MARYGVDYYGGITTYGEAVYVDFDASPVRAYSHSYGRAVVRWAHPEGEWSDIRIVRSRWGYALSIFEGETIYEAPRAQAVELIIDNTLDPGRFYYYQVFVYDSVNLVWRRAGQAQVLALKDFKYQDRMLRHIPDFYVDQSRSISADSEGVSDLEKFLDIFSHGLSHIHGEYLSLFRMRDIDQMSGALVPLLSQDLGIQFEPEIGIRQMRIWLRNAVYLYKVKGTRKGIEGLASSVTGWGARIPDDGASFTLELQAPRVNLMINPSFEIDLSNWSFTNATGVHLEGVYGGGEEGVSGVSAAQLTANAAGTMVAESVSTPQVVEQQTEYSLGFHVRDVTGGASARVGIRWVDATDAEISTSWDDLRALTDEYTRLDFSAIAPLNTVAARAVVEIPDVAAGHVVELDAVILERGHAGRFYFDGGLGGGDFIWADLPHSSPTFYYDNRFVKVDRLNEIMVDYVPIGVTWTIELPTY